MSLPEPPGQSALAQDGLSALVPSPLTWEVPEPGHIGAHALSSPSLGPSQGCASAVPVITPTTSVCLTVRLSLPPQVRPKTLIPDSLPLPPGRDRPPKQPPTFQKATVVSIKNPSPALPTANNTVSHVPTPGSQPQALAEPAAVTPPLSGAGVAYAIISTGPSNAAAVSPSTAVSVVSDSIKVQPLLISADSKVRGGPGAGPGRARRGGPVSAGAGRAECMTTWRDGRVAE